MRYAAAVALCLAGAALGEAAWAQAAPIPAEAPPPSGTSPATWKVERFSAPGFGQEGELVSSLVPGIGTVTATRQVMARLGRPLESAPGPNRTVGACRDAAWAEAAKLGATSIEAASAGRETVDRQGRATGMVLIRVVYAGFFNTEVREAVMTCTTDRRGAIVEARS